MATRRHYPLDAERRRTRDLGVFAESFAFPEPRSRNITVSTYLPLSVAAKARNKVYAYPIPIQRTLRSRVLRYSLIPSRQKMVLTKIRLRVPIRLPQVRPSYVSLRRGKLNVHSKVQHAALISRGEVNRRRYQEFKGHRRMLRYGQLESFGSRSFGAVAETYRRKGSIDKIADAALIARAILKGGY